MATTNRQGQQAEAAMTSMSHENQLKALQWQITSLQQNLQDTQAQMEEERVHTKCQIQMLWASLGRISGKPNIVNRQAMAATRQPQVSFAAPEQSRLAGHPIAAPGPRQMTGQLIVPPGPRQMTGQLIVPPGQPQMTGQPIAAPHPGQAPMTGQLIASPGQPQITGQQPIAAPHPGQPQMTGQLMVAPGQNMGFFYTGLGQRLVGTGQPQQAINDPLLVPPKPRPHAAKRTPAATAASTTAAATTSPAAKHPSAAASKKPAATSAPATDDAARAIADDLLRRAAAAASKKPAATRRTALEIEVDNVRKAPAATKKRPASKRPAAVRARASVSKRPLPATLAVEDDLLLRHHRNIESLWNEYNNGIGKRKAARKFTKKEILKVRVKYHQRKHIWTCITDLVDSGVPAKTAVERIYKVYPDSTINQIIEKLKEDKKAKTVHELLKPVRKDIKE